MTQPTPRTRDLAAALVGLLFLCAIGYGIWGAIHRDDSIPITPTVICPTIPPLTTPPSGGPS